MTAYKQEYAKEWRKFIQGISVAPFHGFDQALSRMNRIGDPANSPLRKLLEKIDEQTIWDNPMADALSKKASGGVVAWFQRVILRRDPADAGKAEQQPVGPIGKTSRAWRG